MRNTRGFTLVEVGVTLATALVGTAIVLPQVQEGQEQSKQSTDALQIRAISQACAIWAQSNRDTYPTPSRVDRDGAVLPRPEGLRGHDLRLDTTGNTLSMLIFNGYFPAELTVSPVEVGNVKAMEDYQFENPPATVDPLKALWDPAFRGTPLDEWGGKVPGAVGDASHNSYAQMVFAGARQAMWSNTFKATEAVWGNRGPVYTLDGDEWVPIKGSDSGDASNTLRLHGEPTSWAGNIGFNDHHGEFLERPDPVQVKWSFLDAGDRGGRILPDNLFHAEHDRTRAPIDEHATVVKDHDASGVANGTGERPGKGALDQRNNYLRPISNIIPGENGLIEAKIWID